MIELTIGVHPLTHADEVEEVLKTVEQCLGQESLIQRLVRLGSLLSPWQELSGPEILQVKFRSLRISKSCALADRASWPRT